MIGWVLSTVFNVFFYVFSFICALFCWVAANIGGRTAMWYVIRVWAWGVIILLRVLLGARIEVRGRQHLDISRSQLIVSKHQSELDIVILGLLFWKLSAVAMEELARLPFFGTILRTAGTVNIAVDRGPQGRTQQMIEGAKRIRAEDRTMVIYPEGELMKLGAKERYKSGAGHLYEAMHVEAVPVAVSLGVIWPRREWRKYPFTVGTIEFMEPIPPGMDREAFMAEIERRIEARTMELIEENATGAVLAAARDRHARGVDNETEIETRV